MWLPSFYYIRMLPVWVEQKMKDDAGQPDSVVYSNGDVLTLIARSYRKAYLWMVKKTCNHHDAEDIVHDAIYDAWVHRDRFRPECKFSSWFLKITLNRYRKYRSKTLNIQPEEVMSRFAVYHNEQTETESLDAVQMKLVMKMVPPQQRKVLEDHHVNGHSTRKSAVRLGISVSTLNEYNSLGIRNARRLWEMVKESLDPGEVPSLRMRFYSLSEVADMYGLNKETIRKEVVKGNLRSVKYGREFRFRKKWIRKWEKENQEWVDSIRKK